MARTNYLILEIIPQHVQEEIAGMYEDGMSYTDIKRHYGRLDYLRSKSKLLNDGAIKTILDKFGVKVRHPYKDRMKK